MEHPNQVLTREKILDRLWDTDGNFIDDNTLSVYVRRLRRKIEDDPEQALFLLTVRGVGYQWRLVR
jgi:DNA-binding response OmpR family regulator